MSGHLDVICRFNIASSVTYGKIYRYRGWGYFGVLSDVSGECVDGRGGVSICVGKCFPFLLESESNEVLW